ncbi:restriction endonuclease subunit S, partial [Rhizobiaceae sp. 2RAB30]
ISTPAAIGFETLVRPLLERVHHNRAEGRTLAATRDLLLPKLMSREIHLRDAEARLEAAQ